VLVVSDASPVILLSRLGLLDLLPELYDRVVIPRAVFHEVVVQGAGLPGSQELRDAEWLNLLDHDPDSLLLRGLTAELGPGEAAALSLATSVQADLVLIDERQGRLVAQRLGLKVKGTVGVLVAARQQGFLPQLRPLLDELVRQGARLSPALRLRALGLVGEPG
jgi:uncharacterized protein